jgi:hypothetical protein
MNIPELIALVMAATQTIKKGLEALLKHPLSAGFAWVISFAVCLFTVAYKAVDTGTVFNFALIIIFVQVLLGANGGFLFLQKILEALGIYKKPV